ncbi:MAG: histidine ammonia-lyase [Alphaproteobacteria bacterium]|nr:histidine ammonia-lyase [Alphaproteobacteria bacterium]
MQHAITLDGDSLNVNRLWEAARVAALPSGTIAIDIDSSAKKRISSAENFLHNLATSGDTVYGVNTGFGFFARTRISPKDIAKLQENIIISHSVGVGELLPRDLVMGMWLIMLNSICRGHRGVSGERVEQILKALNTGMLAHVPARGSVGASGDLAPMSHAVLALLGQGKCSIREGDGFKDLPANEALEKYNLQPLKLGPKEGLALINGTQLTSAMACKLIWEAQRLVETANLTAALMIEAMRASHAFLAPILMKEQRHAGAATCAEAVRNWLQGKTEISQSHADCDRVQDPYSLRCIPQVHGMVWEELENCRQTMDLEINATTDNPILFPEEERVIHGGNFHAIYAARVCDRIGAGLATLANISERRIHMSMKQDKSGLPNFLIAEEGGLNSGFMMTQTTAAALVSECKALSFPASVDSISTNNDQEDHVSMGPVAGLKALKILENARYVLAIELLSAMQGLDLLAPLKTSPRLEAVKATLRAEIPMLKADRFLGEDLEKAAQIIADGRLLKCGVE